MKKAEIKVVVKKQGAAPEVVQIKNELRTFQKLVADGGLIETFPFEACEFETSEQRAQASGILIICDEEGLLKSKELNFYTGLFTAIVGDAVFVSDDGEDFGSLTDKQLEFVLEWTKQNGY